MKLSTKILKFTEEDNPFGDGAVNTIDKPEEPNTELPPDEEDEDDEQIRYDDDEEEPVPEDMPDVLNAFNSEREELQVNGKKPEWLESEEAFKKATDMSQKVYKENRWDFIVWYYHRIEDEEEGTELKPDEKPENDKLNVDDIVPKSEPVKEPERPADTESEPIVIPHESRAVKAMKRESNDSENL